MQQLPDFKIEPIMALSWKAPYAQLMLRGKVETRTWPAKYRGWVLICCSKVPYSGAQLTEIAGADQFDRILNYDLIIPKMSLDFGYAIAIGKLVDCRPMTIDDEIDCFVQYKEPWIETKTLVSGVVKEKRKQLWCHVYENVIPIQHFPFTGGQGWRSLTDEQKLLIQPK
jgi:hypothetical protein